MEFEERKVKQQTMINFKTTRISASYKFDTELNDSEESEEY